MRQASCASAFGRLSAYFQEIHNKHSHVSHFHPFAVRELGVRLRVEDEETADIDIAFRGKRCSGIESKIGVFLHNRKSLVSFILAQIG